MSDPHSRNLRLHRLEDAPATFFVTKSLRPKKPILTPELREVIVDAFDFAIRDGRIYETLIKTARQFTYVAIYIEENPVKKELVPRADEWDQSSANRKDLITELWPWTFDREA